jgi:hypothetical protein
MEFFLTEHLHDRFQRSVAVDVSESGLYVNKLVARFQRPDRVVGLEFELPDSGETIWARGEICRDELDGLFHGTGIAITAIAARHARLLRDYVADARERRLREILTVVKDNRTRLAV